MAKNIRQIVGENIRKLRLAGGMTQLELSQRMKVDRTYIAGLERGSRNITLETLSEAAKALGVKPSKLLDE